MRKGSAIVLALTLTLGYASAANAQRRIFWVDGGNPDLIFRANLDGSNVEEIIGPDDGAFEFSVLAVYQGKVYFPDNAANRVLRANVDGSEIEAIVNPAFPEMGFPVQGIVVNPITGKLIWSGFMGQTYQANLDGTEVVLHNTCCWGLMAIDLVNQKIYTAEGLLGDSTLVSIIDADSSNGQVLFQIPGALIDAIAVDPHAGFLVVADAENHLIYRANLDGSNLQPIVDISPEFFGSVDLGRLAVDPIEQKLYWHNTDSDHTKSHGSSVLRRSDYDGSGIEDILAVEDGFEFPLGIAIDDSAALLPAAGMFAYLVLMVVLVGAGSFILWRLAKRESIRARRLE